jgi:hypothetical protein
VLPKPNAGRKCTPAPSRVGLKSRSSRQSGKHCSKIGDPHGFPRSARCEESSVPANGLIRYGKVSIARNSMSIDMRVGNSTSIPCACASHEDQVKSPALQKSKDGPPELQLQRPCHRVPENSQWRKDQATRLMVVS